MKKLHWLRWIKLLSLVAVAGVLFLIFYNNKVAWKDEIPSYSAVVVKDGKNEVITDNRSVDEVYEAGSIGKTVTAYICLKLVDEGKIDLDEKIYNYLENEMRTKDKRMQQITIRQLLSHTAGFSPSFELGIDRHIYFEPGSSYCYSGVGYIYLQKVLETITGESLETLAKTYVFQPLDMKNSSFETVNTVTSYIRSTSIVLYVIAPFLLVLFVTMGIGTVIGIVTKFRYLKKCSMFYCCGFLSWIAGMMLIIFVVPKLMLYSLLLGVTILALILLLNQQGKKLYLTLGSFMLVVVLLGIFLPISLPVGESPCKKEPNSAYSFCTTANDLARFGSQLLSDCKREPFREMFETQVKIDENNGFGLGLVIEEDGEDCTYWNSGINVGMQSLMVLHPQTNSAVIVMTNSDYGLNEAKKIARKYFELDGIWDIIRKKD